VSTDAEPRARVRVTGPWPGRTRRTSVASEIDARTELGEVYMRSLVRSQLRLAVGTAGVLAATVGLLPLAFWAIGPLQHGRLAGVPLAWWLLGVLVYPLLVGLAVSYVRRAERNEAAFRELVESRERR
jgi:hypothetical protein